MSMLVPCLCPSVFFFNDTATTEIYTLSLHDALPIFTFVKVSVVPPAIVPLVVIVAMLPSLLVTVTFTGPGGVAPSEDRKSTRLNSRHQIISYAVFGFIKITAICCKFIDL